MSRVNVYSRTCCFAFRHPCYWHLGSFHFILHFLSLLRWDLSKKYMDALFTAAPALASTKGTTIDTTYCIAMQMMVDEERAPRTLHSTLISMLPARLAADKYLEATLVDRRILN